MCTVDKSVERCWGHWSQKRLPARRCRVQRCRLCVCLYIHTSYASRARWGVTGPDKEVRRSYLTILCIQSGPSLGYGTQRHRRQWKLYATALNFASISRYTASLVVVKESVVLCIVFLSLSPLCSSSCWRFLSLLQWDHSASSLCLTF